MEVGDEIEIESELMEVEVVAISKNIDGRNIIFFERTDGSLGLFIEGDLDVEVLE
jgi:hypothetical protein